MKEQKISGPRQCGAAPPRQTGIEIKWIEGAGITIKIRLRDKESAANSCDFHLPPDFLPSRAVPLEWDAKDPVSPAFKAKKAGL